MCTRPFRPRPRRDPRRRCPRPRRDRDVRHFVWDETETRPETQSSETETRRFASETRPRRCSCRDVDRDVWYIKIIQHNKIQINWTGKLSKALCICNIVGFSALRNGKWSMFCCCTYRMEPITGTDCRKKTLKRRCSEHVCILVQSSTAWISPPPATISACHADRTECDRLSLILVTKCMMRHNRRSGSRLLSSSGMTVFNNLLIHCQWTSLTLANIC